MCYIRKGDLMNVKEFKFKKSFGQNFLKDDNIPIKIVKTAAIEPNSLVLEVGPGSGMLTKQLSKEAKHVLAYEIDTRLENVLDIELKDYKNISIIYDDFLNRNISNDIKNYEYEKLYLVANLPYYITTPIITKVIESNIDVDKIVIMVQKEVGDRFSAKQGSKEYNSLTIFLNYYFEVKKEFIVSKNNFIPKPNVDSIIVSLTKRKNKVIVNNEERFFQLIRDSFKFKRKNLRNNLKTYDLKKIEEILSKYKMDLNIRAEQISIEIFADISNNL